MGLNPPEKGDKAGRELAGLLKCGPFQKGCKLQERLGVCLAPFSLFTQN